MIFNKFTNRLVLLVIGMMTFGISTAQNSDAPKSLGNTFYLRNCNVVQKPGTILAKQNVLIKDGMIADVGPMVKATFDAQIIAADSMYVYAGFIDGHSNNGIAKPEAKDRPKVSNPGSPPLDIAGITPHIVASESYKSNDKSVGEMRAVGFTVSQVAPRGLMLPGQSAIYMLGEGSADKMLIKGGSAQNFGFDPARGVFPSTSIAVISKFRELYRNASIAGQHEEKFKVNSAGLARPDYSKELAALYPLTTKKQNLNVVANYTKDVHKALSLQDELGFGMTLVEVKQGWHYIDKIKAKNIGVMLSIELPDEEKAKESKDSTSTKKDTTTTKPKEIEKPDPEQESFDKKRAEVNKQYVGQAALFEKNGVPFAFSILSGKHQELKKNIGRMVKAGLSESYALAALTTHPAKMLGLSNVLGTVEKGKIANLVITNKSYFDDKSSIKYVFVDGRKFDFSEPPKKSGENKKDGKEETNIVGLWSYSTVINGETQLGKMNITKDGSTYKISLADDATPADLDAANDIKLDGNKLSFNVTVDMEQPTRLDVDLTFDGKSYKGTVSIPGMGSFPLTGDWISDPKSNN
jgi:imidazolonepropionase-like amidohydrolase